MLKKMQKTENKKKQRLKRGFSMLEMLIAGFILSVGLIGMLRLVAESMKNSMDSRDHVIASGLAQEGLELVRNIRDNSVNPIEGSFEKLPDGNTVGNSVRDDCGVSRAVTAIVDSDCGGSVEKKLYIDSNFFYDHTVSANTTKFQRKIRLQYQLKNGGATTRGGGGSTPSDESDDVYQVDVQSMVMWKAGAFPTDPDDCNLQSKCVMLESTLTKRN